MKRFRNFPLVLFALFFALFTLTACGGGGSTDPGGSNPPPVGFAPRITDLAVGTPSGSSVNVQVTVNPVDLFTVSEARLETSQDNVNWTPTATQTVNPGLPVTLDFGLTSLPAGTTYIRACAFNKWGEDVRHNGDQVTIAPPVTTGTVNVGVYQGDNVVILKNGVMLFEMTAPADNVYTFTVPAGNITGVYKAQYAGFRPFTIMDGAGNNMFQLAGGGTLNLNSVISTSIATGQIVYNVSGSGFTPLNRPPITDASGVPAWTITTVKTGGDYPVTSPSVVVATYTQNQNLITFNDPSLGTVYGTINDNVIYFSTRAYNGAEMVYYRETVVVNAAGNYFAGDMRLDLEGTGRWVTGDVTGTR